MRFLPRTGDGLKANFAEREREAAMAAAANFSMKAALVAATILFCCVTLGRPMRSPLTRQFDKNATNVTVVYMTPHDEFVAGKPISKSSTLKPSDKKR